jgi:uncharacterized protein DUF1153
MGKDARGQVSYVIGPDGYKMTLEDLPAPDTTRWVSRRKAEVVSAVRGGLITLAEACTRYEMTVEEFIAWRKAMDADGIAGLRATRSHQHRQAKA